MAEEWEYEYYDDGGDEGDDEEYYEEPQADYYEEPEYQEDQGGGELDQWWAPDVDYERTSDYYTQPEQQGGNWYDLYAQTYSDQGGYEDGQQYGAPQQQGGNWYDAYAQDWAPQQQTFEDPIALTTQGEMWRPDSVFTWADGSPMDEKAAKQARIYRAGLQQGLDEEGARVLVAVTETEAGLFGALGDAGQSRGPFQFYEGGQMPGFRKWLATQGIQGDANALVHDPDIATQYAASGYLGDAIRRGQQMGLHGSELATYAQRTGQVSVSPERTGSNYQRVFGQGDPFGEALRHAQPDPQARAQSNQRIPPGHYDGDGHDHGVATPYTQQQAGRDGSVWTIAFDYDQPYANPFNPAIPNHRGVDLQLTGAPNGGENTPYTAFRNGRVVSVTNDPHGGIGIIVDTGDPTARYDRYFHNNAVSVKVGDAVYAGQTNLGLIGQTGTEGFPHLHYEVSQNPNGDPPGRTIDPRPYLGPPPGLGERVDRRQGAAGQRPIADPNSWVPAFVPPAQRAGVRAVAGTAGARAPYAPNVTELRTPYSSGRRQTTDGIVIHSTRGQGETPQAEFEWTQRWFGQNPYQVSANAVIGPDGTIAMPRDWDLITHHAGENNGTKFGIELAQSAADAERGVPFTDAQYQSLGWLLGELHNRYGVPIDRQHVVGHEELEQGKRQGKTDPGPNFDWGRAITLGTAGPVQAQAQVSPPYGPQITRQTRFAPNGYGEGVPAPPAAQATAAEARAARAEFEASLPAPTRDAFTEWAASRQANGQGINLPEFRAHLERLGAPDPWTLSEQAAAAQAEAGAARARAAAPVAAAPAATRQVFTYKGQEISEAQYRELERQQAATERIVAAQNERVAQAREEQARLGAWQQRAQAAAVDPEAASNLGPRPQTPNLDYLWAQGLADESGPREATPAANLQLATHLENVGSTAYEGPAPATQQEYAQARQNSLRAQEEARAEADRAAALLDRADNERMAGLIRAQAEAAGRIVPEHVDNTAYQQYLSQGIDPDEARRMATVPETIRPAMIGETPDISTREALGNAAMRGISGFATGLSSAAEMVGSYTGQDWLVEESRARINANAVAAAEAEIERRSGDTMWESPIGFGEAVAENVPSIVGMVVPAIMTMGGSLLAQASVGGARVVAPILIRGGMGAAQAALAAQGVAAAGQQREELRDEVASGQISQGMADAAAIFGGLTEVLTERMLPGLDRTILRGIGQQATREIAQGIAEKGLGHAVGRLGAEALQEGYEEAISEAVSLGIDTTLSSQKPTLTEAASRMISSTAMGAVLGAGMAAPMTAGGAILESRQRAAQQAAEALAGPGLAERYEARGAAPAFQPIEGVPAPFELLANEGVGIQVSSPDFDQFIVRQQTPDGQQARTFVVNVSPQGQPSIAPYNGERPLDASAQTTVQSDRVASRAEAALLHLNDQGVLSDAATNGSMQTIQQIARTAMAADMAPAQEARAGRAGSLRAPREGAEGYIPPSGFRQVGVVPGSRVQLRVADHLPEQHIQPILNDQLTQVLASVVPELTDRMDRRSQGLGITPRVAQARNIAMVKWLGGMVAQNDNKFIGPRNRETGIGTLGGMTFDGQGILFDAYAAAREDGLTFQQFMDPDVGSDYLAVKIAETAIHEPTHDVSANHGERFRQTMGAYQQAIAAETEALVPVMRELFAGGQVEQAFDLYSGILAESALHDHWRFRGRDTLAQLAAYRAGRPGGAAAAAAVRGAPDQVGGRGQPGDGRPVPADGRVGRGRPRRAAGRRAAAQAGEPAPGVPDLAPPGETPSPLVSAEAARRTGVPVELPSDPRVRRALQRTPGIRLTADGLVVDAQRFQRRGSAGAPSLSGNVYYSVAGPGTAERGDDTYYARRDNLVYGGSQGVRGPTVLRRPFVGTAGAFYPEGATAITRAIGDADAARPLQAISAAGFLAGPSASPEQRQAITAAMEQYGVDPAIPQRIFQALDDGTIREQAARSNLSEAVVGEALRRAGYDGYIKLLPDSSVDSIMDVREQTYPDEQGRAELHRQFQPDEARPDGAAARDAALSRAIPTRVRYDPELADRLTAAGLVVDPERGLVVPGASPAASNVELDRRPDGGVAFQELDRGAGPGETAIRNPFVDQGGRMAPDRAATLARLLGEGPERGAALVQQLQDAIATDGPTTENVRSVMAAVGLGDPEQAALLVKAARGDTGRGPDGLVGRIVAQMLAHEGRIRGHDGLVQLSPDGQASVAAFVLPEDEAAAPTAPREYGVQNGQLAYQGEAEAPGYQVQDGRPVYAGPPAGGYAIQDGRPVYQGEEEEAAPSALPAEPPPPIIRPDERAPLPGGMDVIDPRQYIAPTLRGAPGVEMAAPPPFAGPPLITPEDAIEQGWAGIPDPHGPILNSRDLHNRLVTTRFISDRELREILGERPSDLQQVIDFMVEQRQKVVEGRLLPSDVAKAYLMTVSSQGQGAVNADIIRAKTGLAIPDAYLTPNAQGVRQIRAEDASAAWIGSPAGQRALAALDRGEYDEEGWANAASIRAAFSDDRVTNQNVLGTRPNNPGRISMRDVPQLTQELNQIGDDPRAMGEAVAKLNGIGPRKSGFIQHLLGFGEIPTLDARAVNTWITGQGDVRGMDTEAAKIARALNQHLHADPTGLLTLARIISGYNRLRRGGFAPDIPKAVYNAVLHNWLWTRVKGLTRTYAPIYEAQAAPVVEPEAETGYVPQTSYWRNHFERQNDMLESWFKDPYANEPPYVEPPQQLALFEDEDEEEGPSAMAGERPPNPAFPHGLYSDQMTTEGAREAMRTKVAPAQGWAGPGELSRIAYDDLPNREIYEDAGWVIVDGGFLPPSMAAEAAEGEEAEASDKITVNKKELTKRATDARWAIWRQIEPNRRLPPGMQNLEMEAFLDALAEFRAGILDGTTKPEVGVLGSLLALGSVKRSGRSYVKTLNALTATMGRDRAYELVMRTLPDIYPQGPPSPQEKGHLMRPEILWAMLAGDTTDPVMMKMLVGIARPDAFASPEERGAAIAAGVNELYRRIGAKNADGEPIYGRDAKGSAVMPAIHGRGEDPQKILALPRARTNKETGEIEWQRPGRSWADSEPQRWNVLADAAAAVEGAAPEGSPFAGLEGEPLRLEIVKQLIKEHAGGIGPVKSRFAGSMTAFPDYATLDTRMLRDVFGLSPKLVIPTVEEYEYLSAKLWGIGSDSKYLYGQQWLPWEYLTGEKTTYTALIGVYQRVNAYLAHAEERAQARGVPLSEVLEETSKEEQTRLISYAREQDVVARVGLAFRPAAVDPTAEGHEALIQALEAGTATKTQLKKAFPELFNLLDDAGLEIVGKPNVGLGGWREAEDGKYYLDRNFDLEVAGSKSAIRWFTGAMLAALPEEKAAMLVYRGPGAVKRDHVGGLTVTGMSREHLDQMTTALSDVFGDGWSVTARERSAKGYSRGRGQPRDDREIERVGQGGRVLDVEVIVGAVSEYGGTVLGLRKQVTQMNQILTKMGYTPERSETVRAEMEFMDRAQAKEAVRGGPAGALSYEGPEPLGRVEELARRSRLDARRRGRLFARGGRGDGAPGPGGVQGGDLPGGQADLEEGPSAMAGEGPAWAEGWQQPTAEEFLRIRSQSDRGAYLSPTDVAGLSGKQLYVKPTDTGGYAGFALDADNDLQNVFNVPGPDGRKSKGAGVDAMLMGIAQGAETLDAYDDFLPRYYHQFGFRETGRVAFNDEYAPEGWDYETAGRPDVVFMTWDGFHNGESPDDVRARVAGPKDQWIQQAHADEYPDWDAAAEVRERHLADTGRDQLPGRVRPSLGPGRGGPAVRQLPGAGAAGRGDLEEAPSAMVGREVARLTGVPVRTPTDRRFLRAIEIAGGTVDDEGVHLDLRRFQKPELAGQRTLRGGVFYTAATNAPFAEFYREQGDAVGGSMDVQAPSTFRNPMFVWGKNVSRVARRIIGRPGLPPISERMRELAYPGQRIQWAARLSDEERARLEPIVAQVLEEYGGDPSDAPEIAAQMPDWAELHAAVADNAVTAALRRRGHDGLFMVEDSSAATGETYQDTRMYTGEAVERPVMVFGPMIRELVDARERTFPDESGWTELRPEYRGEAPSAMAAEAADWVPVSGLPGDLHQRALSGSPRLQAVAAEATANLHDALVEALADDPYISDADRRALEGHAQYYANAIVGLAAEDPDRLERVGLDYESAERERERAVGHLGRIGRLDALYEAEAAWASLSPRPDDDVRPSAMAGLTPVERAEPFYSRLAQLASGLPETITGNPGRRVPGRTEGERVIRRPEQNPNGEPPPPDRGWVLRADNAWVQPGRETPERVVGQTTAADEVMRQITEGGARPDEIAWSGLETWLREQTGESIARAALVERLSQRRIVVQDAVLGGMPEVDVRVDQDGDGQLVEEEPYKVAEGYYDEEGDWVEPEYAYPDYENPEYRYTFRAQAYAGFDPTGDERTYEATGNDDQGYWVTDQNGIAIQHSPIDSLYQSEKAIRDHAQEAMHPPLPEGVQGPYQFIHEPGQPEAMLVLPGGEEYRELLIIMPASREALDAMEREADAASDAYHAFTADYSYDQRVDNPELRDRAIELLEAANAARTRLDATRAEYERSRYTGSHFYGFDNVALHVRFNERIDADGKRLLFIEELQSDWQQQGRERGFLPKKGGLPKGYAIELRPVPGVDPSLPIHVGGRYDERTRSFVDERLVEPGTPEHALQLRGRSRWYLTLPQTEEVERALRHAPGREGPFRTEEEAQIEMRRWLRELRPPPEMPFMRTESWATLGFRRMIRWAAEHGYERIGWTTGQQQNDRYGPARIKNPQALPKFYDGVLVTVATDLGKPWGVAPAMGRISVSDTGRYSEVYQEGDGWRYRTPEGDSIGGYPTREAAEEQARKADERFGYADDVHVMDIPPQMVRSALEEGQPLFMAAERPEAEGTPQPAWDSLSPEDVIDPALIGAVDRDGAVQEIDDPASLPRTDGPAQLALILPRPELPRGLILPGQPEPAGELILPASAQRLPGSLSLDEIFGPEGLMPEPGEPPEISPPGTPEAAAGAPPAGGPPQEPPGPPAPGMPVPEEPEIDGVPQLAPPTGQEPNVNQFPAWAGAQIEMGSLITTGDPQYGTASAWDDVEKMIKNGPNGKSLSEREQQILGAAILRQLRNFRKAARRAAGPEASDWASAQLIDEARRYTALRGLAITPRDRWQVLEEVWRSAPVSQGESGTLEEFVAARTAAEAAGDEGALQRLREEGIARSGVLVGQGRPRVAVGRRSKAAVSGEVARYGRTMADQVDDGSTPTEVGEAAASPDLSIHPWEVLSGIRYNNMLIGPRGILTDYATNTGMLFGKIFADPFLLTAHGVYDPRAIASISAAEYAALARAVPLMIKRISNTFFHGVEDLEADVVGAPRKISGRLSRRIEIAQEEGAAWYGRRMLGLRAGKVGAIAFAELAGRFKAVADVGIKELAYGMEMTRQAAIMTHHEGRFPVGSRQWHGRVAEILAGNIAPPNASKAEQQAATVQHQEMQRNAQREAERTTFQGEMGTIGRGMEVIQRHPLGQFALPFLRTLYHIRGWAIDFSPLGLAATTGDVIRGKIYRSEMGSEGGRTTMAKTRNMGGLLGGPYAQAWRGANVGPGVADLDRRLLANAIGTAGFFYLLGMAFEGALSASGPPDDPIAWLDDDLPPPEARALRATMEANGWRRNSVKIPWFDGKQYWVNYSNWGPLGYLMGAAATIGEAYLYGVAADKKRPLTGNQFADSWQGIQDLWSGGDGQTLRTAGRRAMGTIGDLTFVSGMLDLFKLTETGYKYAVAPGPETSSQAIKRQRQATAEAGAWASWNVLGSFMPAGGLIRTIAQSQDPYARSTDFGGIREGLAYGVPELGPADEARLPFGLTDLLANRWGTPTGRREGLAVKRDALGQPVESEYAGVYAWLPFRATEAHMDNAVLNTLLDAKVGTPTPPSELLLKIERPGNWTLVDMPESMRQEFARRSGEAANARIQAEMAAVPEAQRQADPKAWSDRLKGAMSEVFMATRAEMQEDPQVKAQLTELARDSSRTRPFESKAAIDKILGTGEQAPEAPPAGAPGTAPGVPPAQPQPRPPQDIQSDRDAARQRAGLPPLAPSPTAAPRQPSTAPPPTAAPTPPPVRTPAPAAPRTTPTPAPSAPAPRSQQQLEEDRQRARERAGLR